MRRNIRFILWMMWGPWTVGNGILKHLSVFSCWSPAGSCLSVHWSAAAWVSFGHHIWWYVTKASYANRRSQFWQILVKLAAKKTSLRSLPVGRVCNTEVAGAFSAFPYCRKLPPSLLAFSCLNGRSQKRGGTSQWLIMGQSSRRTSVLWEGHPKAPAPSWCLESPHWYGLLCWVV